MELEILVFYALCTRVSKEHCRMVEKLSENSRTTNLKILEQQILEQYNTTENTIVNIWSFSVNYIIVRYFLAKCISDLIYDIRSI